MKTHFSGHPLGQSILGSKASISALEAGPNGPLPRRALSRRQYHVAVAGNTQWEEVVELANQCCGEWEAGSTPRPTDEARPKGGKSVIAKESSTQQHVMQMAPAPAAKIPFAWRPNFFRSSWGMIREAGSTGTWSTRASPNRPIFHTTNMTAAVRISPTYAPHPNRPRTISAGSLRFTTTSTKRRDRGRVGAGQNKVESRIVLRSERPMGRLSSLGSNWVYRGEYRSVQDDLDSFRQISGRRSPRPAGRVSLGPAFNMPPSARWPRCRVGQVREASRPTINLILSHPRVGRMLAQLVPPYEPKLDLAARGKIVIIRLPATPFIAEAAWRGSRSTTTVPVRRRLIEQFGWLETGDILFFPSIPFQFPPADQQFLLGQRQARDNCTKTSAIVRPRIA